MNDTLDQLTDAELSECFAVTMGVPCDPDDYATSADAVLPWLEKCRRWKAQQHEPNVVWVDLDAPTYGDACAPTFARAACIALIRANNLLHS